MPASMSSTSTIADCRPRQRGGHPLAVHGGLQLAGQFARRWRRPARRSAVTSTLAAISSCSAWLIRSAATCTGIGGVVGQDRDLGRAGFGVDADLRAADPLGGGDVDVARPGDHVDRRQFGAVGVGAAVGQQRHGLGTADGPHLVDAEQAGGGQDGRVRQAVELAPAAGSRSPASPRRRSARAPRSSPRWTDRPRCRRARTGRPARRAPSVR